MFNGLIREIAEVISFSGNSLRIRAKFRPEHVGDSIAINGACLSVTQILADGFVVEISSETAAVIATGNFKGRVHIEPAMRLGERIDGHLVQGHIDGVGEIAKITKLKSGYDFFINLPKNLMPFVANKGSVAIDGVSLTINEVLSSGIRLTIIPQTMIDTLFGEYNAGRKVNVETDLLARYAARILGFKNEKESLSWDQVNLISSLY
ncbi:MAG: riboflavin synthase [Campylobacter sp.]|nr:riboflavin synthase [Campylobacter sp.]